MLSTAIDAAAKVHAMQGRAVAIGKSLKRCLALAHPGPRKRSSDAGMVPASRPPPFHEGLHVLEEDVAPLGAAALGVPGGGRLGGRGVIWVTAHGHACVVVAVVVVGHRMDRWQSRRSTHALQGAPYRGTAAANSAEHSPTKRRYRAVPSSTRQRLPVTDRVLPQHIAVVQDLHHVGEQLQQAAVLVAVHLAGAWV